MKKTFMILTVLCISGVLAPSCSDETIDPVEISVPTPAAPANDGNDGDDPDVGG